MVESNKGKKADISAQLEALLRREAEEARNLSISEDIADLKRSVIIGFRKKVGNVIQLIRRFR